MVALLCITKYSAVTLIDKGKIELYQTATKRDLVHDSCGVIHLSGRPISQIPKCTCPISHNTLIRTETCTFLFWMVYCGMWDKCTVGFVNLVYSSCIVSDEKYKKLFEKTFWVPFHNSSWDESILILPGCAGMVKNLRQLLAPALLWNVCWSVRWKSLVVELNHIQRATWRFAICSLNTWNSQCEVNEECFQTRWFLENKC